MDDKSNVIRREMEEKDLDETASVTLAMPESAFFILN